MVWQSSSAHNASQEGPNSNGGGAGGQQQQGNGNPGVGPQVVGAEYTLQGVMRFLQTEWHKHERDRNDWEIERAEMKARIAKLEGESRASKRLHQVYLSRIKILEGALKKERADRISEGKAPPPDDPDGDAQGENDKAKITERLKEIEESHNYAEAGRNKSRQYLEKCLQEITYLLTPPSHPPPQQVQSHNLDPLFPQQSIDHSLFQQQQHHSSLQQALQHPSPSPNHQPPPPPPPNDLSQSHIRAAQSIQNLPNHGSPFQVESRLPTASPQPPASSTQDKPSQNAYSSLRGEYGKKDTNPFSASAGIEARSGSGAADPIEDAWDFDDKIIGNEADNAFTAAALSEEFPEYGSLNHKPNNVSSQRRKLSLGKRRSSGRGQPDSGKDSGNFKIKFVLRGHLDVVRSVVFTGGGTVNEPEICTTGDDGVIKRWFIPGSYNLSIGSGMSDVDVTSHFTHRGHSGIVTSLAACPANRADGTGDGWVFSGGQDATVRVWETGKVDAKATLVGHTDTVWAVCVLPSPTMLGSADERVLLASGSADGTVKIWSITPPPLGSSRPGSSASGSSSSSFSSSHSNLPFEYSLISTITRPDGMLASPTCITPMSVTGETFIVSYNDAAVIIYDTASGEEVVAMASQETYDGTPATGINTVVATTTSLDQGTEAGKEEEIIGAGPTGSTTGVNGMVITGHEDQYVRIYDANSGQCTYTMLAHPAAIASLALSPDGRELVSAGHDAGLRFWSMEKRTCSQEIMSHRLMRGEGVCTVVWSVDGRWVVSGGGDGVVKVYCR